MNKNILYILSNFPCYTETFILDELLELKKRNYEIVIFSLKKPKEKIFQKESLEFLKKTIYLPFISFKFILPHLYFLLKKPYIYLKLLLEIIRFYIIKPILLIKNLSIFPKSVYFAYYLRNKKIYHIHAHFANYPTTSALIIAKLMNLPFTFTCHAHDIFYDSTMLDVKIKESKACIAISYYNRNFILNIYPDLPKNKIEVIHCGINLERFSFRGKKYVESKVRILSVGRIMPTKGFDDLIYACKLLKEKNIDFICQIVGEGKEENHLKNLVKKFNLEGRVIFLGPLTREEILNYYKSADIFVLASKRTKHPDVQDGIPLVLMEAMAIGIPVISTRFSGIPELIEDDINGFLVETNNPIDIAQKILDLVINLNKRETLIKNARIKIEKEFNIKKNVDLLERIFNQ